MLLSLVPPKYLRSSNHGSPGSWFLGSGGNPDPGVLNSERGKWHDCLRENLIGHVLAWPAEQVERCCGRITEETHQISSHGITKVNFCDTASCNSIKTNRCRPIWRWHAHWSDLLRYKQPCRSDWSHSSNRIYAFVDSELIESIFRSSEFSFSGSKLLTLTGIRPFSSPWSAMWNFVRKSYSRIFWRQPFLISG